MSTSEEAFPLSGVIACVTGATRGIGKGIALGLAEQGATIYVTGRSLNSDSCTEQVLGGTLADLVVEIEALGGKCVPVQCDHREDVQVENLFKQISVEHGKLDILVNNAFQVPSLPDGAKDKDLLFRDFWEQPGWFWDSFMTVGLRSHYVASCYAVPMLKAAVADASKVNRKPMIIHISSFGGVSYSFNVAYGVGKAGVDRMAKDMQKELVPLDIRSIALWPGVVRTERMVDILDSGEWKEKTGLETPKIFVESPMLTGRVIAAIYTNKDKTSIYDGSVGVVAEIAKTFEIKDPITGITPPSIRSLKFLVPSIVLWGFHVLLLCCI